MTDFDETETRFLTTNDLVSFSKRLGYKAHYKGEDEDEKIMVTTDFYVTDRQNITKELLNKIRKEKNRIWEFNIPRGIPALPDEVASAWQELVEY